MKKPRHDGAAGDAEILGDFIVRKSLDFAKREHCAVFWRECRDRAFEALVALAVLEILSRITLGGGLWRRCHPITAGLRVAGIGGIGQKGNETIEPAFPAPQVIDGAAGGNWMHPGGELRLAPE